MLHRDLPLGLVYELLSGRFHNRLAAAGKGCQVHIRILFAHHGDEGGFRPWQGFELARQFVEQARAEERQPVPILILGMHSIDTVRKYQLPVLTLEFSGIQYLSYLVNDNELAERAATAIQGALLPLPSAWNADLVARVTNTLASLAHELPQYTGLFGIWRAMAASGAPVECLPQFADNERLVGITLLENYATRMGCDSAIGGRVQEIVNLWRALDAAWTGFNAIVCAGCAGLEASEVLLKALQLIQSDLDSLIQEVSNVRKLLVSSSPTNGQPGASN